MRAKFVSIYRLLGATSVMPEIENGTIYAQDHPKFVATATNDASRALAHLDRKTALAKLILTGFGKSRRIAVDRGMPPGSARARAVMRQTDERIEWFRRNAPGFRSEQLRSQLAQAQTIAEGS